MLLSSDLHHSDQWLAESLISLFICSCSLSPLPPQLCTAPVEPEIVFYQMTSSLHLSICDFAGLQVVAENFNRSINSISVFCTWTIQKISFGELKWFCWVLATGLCPSYTPCVLPQRLSAADATASGYKVLCRMVGYTNKAYYMSVLLVCLFLSSRELTRTKSFYDSLWLWGPPLRTGWWALWQKDLHRSGELKLGTACSLSL